MIKGVNSKQNKPNNSKIIFEIIKNPRSESMAEKIKLMESMSNLIQHVSSSHRNQEEIFATLSTTDLKKILSNLQDTNERLRKITLMLLAELMYENVGLQRRFCELMEIPHFSGKVVLTHSFPKSVLTDPQALLEITKILKDQSTIKQRGLFWYIDSLSKPKILQIGRRNSFTIDPLTCIAGFWMLEDSNGNTIGKDLRLSAPRTKLSQNPNLLTPQRQQIKNINPLNGKVRLNRSQHIQKYQEHSFKPETPMKSSLTQDQNGYLTTRPREHSHQWNPQTPQVTKSQLKPSPQTEIIRYNATTDRKNYQPSVSTFDTIRYIKANNFVGGSGQAPHTTTHRVEQRVMDQPISSINYSNRVPIYQEHLGYYKKS